MTNREAIRKLLGLLRPYVKIIVFIMSSLIISTILNLCIPLLSKEIMDKGFIEGDHRLLIQLVIITLMFQLINSLINILKEKKRIEISAKIQFYLSKQSFEHLMKLRIHHYNNTNYAELQNKLEVDIDNMIRITDESLFFVITQMFTIIGGIIGLCIISVKLTLIVIMFMPLKYLIVKYFAKKESELVEYFINKSGEYSKWFGDALGGIREIRLFQIMSNKEKEFIEKQMDVVNSKKQLNFLNKCNLEVDTVLIHLLIFVIYIVGANMFFDLKLSVGSIFAFITYSAYVTNPISAILNIGYMLAGVIPSTKRYYEFLSLEEEKQIAKQESDEFLDGDIEFKDVCFSYEKGVTTLDRITMNIKKGSKIALIGLNGSGKSTIINLLLRLYNVDSGSIFLNGKDINNYNIEDYRDKISVVSQQVYLFNGTIRDNIKLYKNINDSIILEAAYDSGLKDFINEKSLDYVVGENGSMLSGGQKQKIALARALIHNKQFIIFDEATSNTDIYSETQINKLLKTKLKERTVIVVTHKTEILKEVDYIILLKSGRVDFCGTYNELLENNIEFKMIMQECNAV